MVNQVLKFSLFCAFLILKTKLDLITTVINKSCINDALNFLLLFQLFHILSVCKRNLLKNRKTNHTFFFLSENPGFMLKTCFWFFNTKLFVLLQITHMADFHQITSISITRIPLITASVQTDKQKATVSLKVLGAAEVCLEPLYINILSVQLIL